MRTAFSRWAVWAVPVVGITVLVIGLPSEHQEVITLRQVVAAMIGALSIGWAIAEAMGRE